ncbi:MAG: glycosyltransferase [Deltaproteobacteria bacterium]|nr:glycosyltransferase [Deltaproteobacteria bacterium]
MPLTLTYLCFNYNYASYLSANLRGLRAQTRTPDRVVVSDDCSSDTLETLQGLCGDLPNCEVVKEPKNLGPLQHYRKRIAEVTTDAYLLTSADDYLVDPDYVADCLAVLERHPQVVAVFGLHQPTGDGGQPMRSLEIESTDPVSVIKAPIARRRLAYINFMPAVCTVIRTAAHHKMPAFPLANPHCADWMQFYLLTQAGDFARLNRVAMHYRIHSSNMSVAFDAERMASKHVDEGYADLLATPGLSDDDRRHLRLGRMRHAVINARVAELPGVLLAAKGHRLSWQALLETLADRVSRRAQQWSTAWRQRQIPPLEAHCATSTEPERD